MKRESGFAMIELLVAAGIMLAATAAVFAIVNSGLARSASWDEAVDLSQRGRVAAETVSRVVAAAGAGGLHPLLPALEPRRRSSFLASSAAITIRHAPEAGARTTLVADLLPGATVASIDLHRGCVAGAVACGFTAGTEAAVLDGTGGWHLLSVTAIATGLVTFTDAVPGRIATFTAGAGMAEVLETSLYFDAATGTLRQEGPGGGDFPVVDNIAAVQFEYFTDSLAPLPLSSLVDGPLCGSGALAYDCDLLTMRAVRASLRVSSPRAAVLPLSITVDISPRNMQR